MLPSINKLALLCFAQTQYRANFVPKFARGHSSHAYTTFPDGIRLSSLTYFPLASARRFYPSQGKSTDGKGLIYLSWLQNCTVSCKQGEQCKFWYRSECVIRYYERIVWGSIHLLSKPHLNRNTNQGLIYTCLLTNWVGLVIVILSLCRDVRNILVSKMCQSVI